MAVDPSFVYWVNFGDNNVNNANGSVRQLSKAGGSAQTLAPGQPGAFAVVVSSGVVFWARCILADCEVWRINADGTGMQSLYVAGQLGNGGTVDGLAVDAQFVYFPDAMYGKIYEVSTQGGPAQSVVTGEVRPIGMAERMQSLFWANYPGTGQSTSTLRKATTTGSGVQDVSAGEHEPRGLMADDRGIYWATSDGNVIMFDLTVQSRMVIASGQNVPVAVATDDQFIYWANQGRAAMDGSIARAPKPPHVGGIETLAPNQADPQGIAVDGSFVYWANRGSDTIMRLAK